MSQRTTTMLADDAVARREERLRSVAPLQDPWLGRCGILVSQGQLRGRARIARGPSHGQAPAVALARTWAGRALERGGRALTRAGARVAGERGPKIPART